MSTSEYPAPSLDRPRFEGLRELMRVRPISADVWALLALVALATAIRIVTINNQSFWADEALTAYEAQLPFGAMLNTVAHVETTPPLYFVLMWGWAHIFGIGEIALRSVSTLAGIALVPIAYLSARELYSRWAGVVAAAFVAVNPFMIWFSQEARAYMLLALFTGAGFLWFVRAREDPSRRNLTWWVVCSGLALMTHFFAGFAVAPEALWLLWRSRERLVLIAVGLVAAVQVAMLPFAVIDTTHGVNWIAQHSRVTRVGTAAVEWAASLEYRRTPASTGFLGAAVLIVVVAMLLALGGDDRARRGAMVGAVIGGCVIILPLAIAFLGQDYWLSRNVMPGFIPLVTTVAIACVVPRARILGGALAVALLAIFCVSAYNVQTLAYLQRPDWRNVAHALGPARATRAVLAADGLTADPLKIYMPGVQWVVPKAKRVLISEVDVVGATKKLALIAPKRLVETSVGKHTRLQEGSLSAPAVRVRRTRFGSPVPQTVAPAGARLLARFRVDNWIVARFALDHPMRLSIRQLNRLAPAFFLRTPKALLVFLQESQH